MDVEELLEEIQADLEANDLQAIRDRAEYMEELHEWLRLDRFDRRAVNHQLEQYAMSRRPDGTAERSRR
jgi:Spy/CpxP family protein refolding chaperone